ncbi:MAG: DUF433 domain-containing protein [Opitutae bacterium]|nr:DUF433 domain-containing protein [Opitutae bacterium]
MESDPTLLRRITRDPKFCDGRAAVRDTAISVAQIVQALAAQATEPELLAKHTALEPADIRAALLYAARVVRS